MWLGRIALMLAPSAALEGKFETRTPGSDAPDECSAEGWPRYRAAEQTEDQLPQVVAEHVSEFATSKIFRVGAHLKLVINGVMMSSTQDERRYHEMLVHPALLAADVVPRDVLIIGGGEGATLREVLSDPRVERATMVDIDAGVIQMCKEHLRQMHEDSFDSPRARVIIGDGRVFASNATAKSYDVVIVDGVDFESCNGAPDVGNPLFDLDFYTDLHRLLRPGGAMAQYISDVPSINAKTLFAGFDESLTFGTLVPSFGGGGARFVLASKGSSQGAIQDGVLRERVQQRIADAAPTTKWVHLSSDTFATAIQSKERLLKGGLEYTYVPMPEDYMFYKITGSDNWCWQYNVPTKEIYLDTCWDRLPNQEWIWKPKIANKTGKIISMADYSCATVQHSFGQRPTDRSKILMQPCDDSNNLQEFAYDRLLGAIRMVSNPTLCVDFLKTGLHNHYGVYTCWERNWVGFKSSDHQDVGFARIPYFPNNGPTFNYTLPMQDGLRFFMSSTGYCIDKSIGSFDITFYECTGGANQQWVWLQRGDAGMIYSGATLLTDPQGECLVAAAGTIDSKVTTGPCDQNNALSKWIMDVPGKRLKLSQSPTLCVSWARGSWYSYGQYQLATCVGELDLNGPNQDIVVHAPVPPQWLPITPLDGHLGSAGLAPPIVNPTVPASAISSLRSQTPPPPTAAEGMSRLYEIHDAPAPVAGARSAAAMPMALLAAGALACAAILALVARRRRSEASPDAQPIE